MPNQHSKSKRKVTLWLDRALVDRLRVRGLKLSPTISHLLFQHLEDQDERTADQQAR